MVRYQNLTRKTELFRAPLGRGTMYPLNPPLQALPVSDLTRYVYKPFATLELCDNIIHKTELHERDAAENVKI